MENLQSGEHFVQKSRPIQAIQQCHLSLLAFKILDAYLSRIDINDDNVQQFELKERELLELFGTPNAEPETVVEALAALMKPLKFHFDDRILIFQMFSTAEVYKGSRNVSMIRLKCHEEARKYIFNIQTIGYLKYSLSEIVKLSSKYSYLMYLYIKNSARQYYGKDWRVETETLKRIIDLYDENRDTYMSNTYLAKVIDRAKKEIEEKTDVRFTCTSVKSGPVITAWDFHLGKETADRVQLEIYNEDKQKQKKIDQAVYQERLESDADFRQKEKERAETLGIVAAAKADRVMRAEQKAGDNILDDEITRMQEQLAMLKKKKELREELERLKRELGE